MRPRALLVLSMLVVALGLFIWLFERDMPSTEERRELEGKVVPLELDEVEAVVIESDGQRVRLERDVPNAGSILERSWKVAEPISAPADEDKILALLRQLTALEKERTVEAVEAGTVGLDHPRQRIALETSGSAQMLLEVGSDVPASDSVVLRVDGDRILVADGSFRDQVEVEPGEWRSRDLLEIDEQRVSRIAASGAFGDISIVREDGRYMLESPIADEADQDAVSDLIAELDDLSVLEFIDDPIEESSTGLAPPHLVVTLEVVDHDPIVLRFGSVEDEAEEEGGRYLALGDRSYSVRTDLLNLIDRPVTDWQSTAWSRLEPFEVDTAVIRQGGEVLTLERRGAEWLREGNPIAYADVAEFLDVVSDLGTAGVLPHTVLEEGAEAEIEIELAGDSTTDRLTLVRAPGGEFLALREGRDVGLSVAGDEVAKLSSAVADVRSSAVQDEDSFPAGESSETAGS